jgi:Toprim-like
MIAATNADDAGHRYAERLAELARAADVRFERILPPGGVKDWNDHLRARANVAATPIPA